MKTRKRFITPLRISNAQSWPSFTLNSAHGVGVLNVQRCKKDRRITKKKGGANTYILQKWIPEDKLNIGILCSNPNAIDYLKNFQDNIDWANLSENPIYFDLVDYLRKTGLGKKVRIDYQRLALNPNPKASEKIIEDIYRRKTSIRVIPNLAKNPNSRVINYLKKELELNTFNNWDSLSENPMIDEIYNDTYKQYSHTYKYINDNNLNKLNWTKLSANPGAISILKDEYKRNPSNNRLNWEALSGNSGAIELLKEEYKRNPDDNRLNWEKFSSNPGAIELLKEEYKRNPDDNRLNWKALSGNLMATSILEEEYKRNPSDNQLNWEALSGNLMATSILYKEYKRNPSENKLNWRSLSGNPSIVAIELIREEYTRNNNLDLDWDKLSKNPYIFTVGYDLNALKEAKKSLHQEHIDITFNPDVIGPEILKDPNQYEKVKEFGLLHTKIKIPERPEQKGLTNEQLKEYSTKVLKTFDKEKLQEYAILISEKIFDSNNDSLKKEILSKLDILE